MNSIEEVFDSAIELVLNESDERKAIEVSFETAGERESFRLKLYKQKELMKKKFPDVAKLLLIRSISDPENSLYKVRLSKLKPLNVEVINL